MKTFKQILLTLIFVLFIAAVWSAPTRSQTLNTKLEQQTDFVPKPASSVEQLVEVARQFKIPMGIEWFERSNAKPQSVVTSSGGSVLQLLNAILQQSPEHQLVIEDRMLRVFPPSVVSHPFNFLNLHISSYQVKDESLLGAEAMLRTKINMMLYPDLYKNGYGGGYGGAADSVFWERNISLIGQDLTIREILTKIAEANGNALWLVRLSPEELADAKPKWLGVPINKYGHSPINDRWRFIALSECCERSNNGLQRTRN